MLKYAAIVTLALCMAFSGYAAEETEKNVNDSAQPETAAGADKQADKKDLKIFPVTMGGLEIIALLDTLNEGDTALLVDAGPEDLERAKAPGGLENSVQAFIVKMNGKTILFDAGFSAAMGGIQPALLEAGIKAEDIDAIVITHFHFDHVGGLLDGDKAVFPKAELFLPKIEIDKWSDPGTKFMMVYGPRTNVFDANKEILPGVTALPAYGHTPGHTIYRLEKDGGSLLIIGDLIHFPGVQLANPDLAVTYDKDPVKAVQARKRVFEQAASEKLPIASMHMRFPGMGILVKDGKGYTFEKIAGVSGHNPN